MRKGMTALALVLLSPALWGKGNDPEWRLHLKMADEQLHERDLLQAEKHLKEAWNLAEEFGPRDPRLAFTAIKLGGVYADLHQVNDARKLYEFAIPIFKEMEDDGLVQLAFAYRQVGDLEFQLGKYNNAIEQYIDAIRVYDALGDDHGLPRAACLFGLARAYRHLKDAGKAATCAIEAIRILEESEEKPDNHATIVAELGQVYLLKGDLPRAESVFQQALKIAREAHDETHRETAYLLNSYAQVLRLTGRSKLADEYTAKASKIEHDVH